MPIVPGWAPESASDDAILLTGATGFVGMAVLVRLLERTDRRILALVRAGSQDEADRRLDSLMGSLFAGSDTGVLRQLAASSYRSGAAPDRRQ